MPKGQAGESRSSETIPEQTSPNGGKRPIIATGVALALTVIGIFWSSLEPAGSLIPYITAATAVIVISGTSFLAFFHARDIRHAIAVSFVLTYFTIIAMLLFLPRIRQSLFNASPQVGAQLVGDLTKFVSVIISAYFIGSAIEAGITSRRTESGPSGSGGTS